jgi:transposase
MNSVVYVGMDVDKEKAVIAVLRGTETEISGESVIRNERSAVRKFFSKLNGCGKVIACYEAGCFGFELYRQLNEMGVACMVVAPGLIPHRPSDRVKTDRRDARTLVRALRNGDLTRVYVPTKKDESVRDYLRMYEDTKGDLKRINGNGKLNSPGERKQNSPGGGKCISSGDGKRKSPGNGKQNSPY